MSLINFATGMALAEQAREKQEQIKKQLSQEPFGSYSYIELNKQLREAEEAEQQFSYYGIINI